MSYTTLLFFFITIYFNLDNMISLSYYHINLITIPIIRVSMYLISNLQCQQSNFFNLTLTNALNVNSIIIINYPPKNATTVETVPLNYTYSAFNDIIYIIQT